jgi:hypothetical protein
MLTSSGRGTIRSHAEADHVSDNAPKCAAWFVFGLVSGEELLVRRVSLAALLLALAVGGFAYAGEQTNHAQSEKERAREVATGSETTAPSRHTALVQAGATGGALRYRLNCRMQTYVIKKDLSKAEVKDFTAGVTYRFVANLDGSGNKDMGEILDDVGVPAYDGLCG